MENIPNMRLHSFWEASGTVAIPKVNTKVDNGTLFFFFCCIAAVRECLAHRVQLRTNKAVAHVCQQRIIHYK